MRLGHLLATRLDDGRSVPGFYFTFQLELGAQPRLKLLRAFRVDDPRVLLRASAP